ncbi:arf-GAP with Rho-GAP domain, partial [Tropilaelaps mercedesae]
MLVFPDTYDLPNPMDPALGEQDSDRGSALSVLVPSEPTYDIPLVASTTTPPPLSPSPPSEPPPSPFQLSSSSLLPPMPPLTNPPPSPLLPLSGVTLSPSLFPTNHTLPTQQLISSPMPMRPQSPSSLERTITPPTDSGRSSSSSGVSSATPTLTNASTTEQYREQITNPRPPPVPAPRQKAPPPLPPKTEVTPPRARPYSENRKFSLQNTNSSATRESVMSESGNSLTSWYLDTNQIRNYDIPHRELTAGSEDGNSDPSSLPYMTPTFSPPLKHSLSAKSISGGVAGLNVHHRSGSKILSSAIRISNKFMRKQSVPTTFSSESWDSNSADSDSNEGIVLYFSQVDRRKDYCQRLCVIGDGCLKFYENDSMTSPSLCLCCDEITLLLARRDIWYSINRSIYHYFELHIHNPSSKSAPSLFLIDIRASGLNRGLGFTSAIERAEFLRKVNHSFNPGSFQLQGEVWASGSLWCRYSISGDWQNVKAVLHGKEFTPFPADCCDRSDGESSYGANAVNITAHLTIDLRKAKAIEWTPLSQACGADAASVVSGTGASGMAVAKDRIFHIVLPGRTVYLRGPTSHETLAWFELLEKTHTTYLDKSLLSEQYLNEDNVPLAVEKCVNFVSAHGSDLTGVYRLAGSHVKIERLVEALKRNAWEVHLVPEDYSAHDVANALRRFLRSFDDCLLTQRLYESWAKCSKIKNLDERLPRLKDIISELPTVEHATLRYLCSHLKAISDRQELNCMTVANLASIFGPTILYKEPPTAQGYLDRDLALTPTTSLAETNYGLTIAADLLANFCFLFDVSQEVVEKERQIQRLMAELREARVAQRPAGDILVGVHIYNREWGRCLNIKLTPMMTAFELCRSVRTQLKLADSANTLAVFEMICDQQLERPLHHSESVFRTVLRWTDWDTEFTKGNYLLVRRNYIYDDVVNFRNNVMQPLANSSEILFAEAGSKTFKKVSMEFARAALQIVK